MLAGIFNYRHFNIIFFGYIFLFLFLLNFEDKLFNENLKPSWFLINKLFICILKIFYQSYTFNSLDYLINYYDKYVYYKTKKNTLRYIKPIINNQIFKEQDKQKFICTSIHR